MNQKTLLVVIGAIIVVGVGGVGYLASRPSSSRVESPAQVTATTTTTTATTTTTVTNIVNPATPAPVAPTEPSPPPVDLVFTDYEGVLNTSANTYTDTFAKPPLVITMTLTSSERASIAKMLSQSQLFSPRLVQDSGPVLRTNPCFAYSLQAKVGGTVKQMSWDCADNNPSRKAFVQYLLTLISSRPAYKNLPFHPIPL